MYVCGCVCGFVHVCCGGGRFCVCPCVGLGDNLALRGAEALEQQAGDERLILYLPEGSFVNIERALC